MPLTSTQNFTYRKFTRSARLSIKLIAVALLSLQSGSLLAQSCPEPSFHSARNFDTGLSEPTQIAVADFNKDGYPDLVVGGGSTPVAVDSGVAVLMNSGAGSFDRPLYLPASSGSNTGLWVGDFDGDGNADILTGSLRFFYGDGNGAFRGPIELVLHEEAGRTWVADLNNDGRTDLIHFNNAIPASDTVLLSRPGGGFDEIPGPMTIRPSHLTFGDFNGDSKIDLLVAHDTVQVYLGDGLGHFAPQSPAGISPLSPPQIDDFNGDGKLDAVFTTSQGTTFLAGTGNGGFSSPITGNSLSTVIAVGDFNEDGKPDVAVTAPFTGMFKIGIGNGAGLFTEAAPKVVGGHSVGLVVNDFNADNNLDIVSVNPRADDVSVVFGDGSGNFVAGDFYKVGNGLDLLAVATGDFNGDGKLDFATVEEINNRIHFLDGNGAGGFVESRVSFQTTSFNHFASGDFNHDGRADLICLSQTGNQFIIIFGNGSIRGGPLQGANSVATGDFNNDSHLDLAVTGIDSYGIVLGNGAGELSPVQKVSLGTKPTGISAGDFNGDSKLDLAIANQEPNSVSILIGDGAGNFTPGSAIDLNPSFFQVRTIAAADFNSDSKTDLAVSSENPNLVIMFQGNGNGSFGAATSYEVGDSIRQITATDFNSDGKIDLAVVKTNDSSSISLLLNDGIGNLLKRVNYGVGYDPRQLGFGDFNNDSKPDLVVANANASLGNGSSVAVILSAPCRPLDLTLSKSHEGNFAVGVPGVYRLRTTNKSLLRTKDPTTITDLLPQGLSFVSGNGVGWQCSAVGQLVTCSHNGLFEAGETSEVSLTVSPAAAAMPGVTNSATVNNPLDINAANDISNDPTIVNPGVSITGRVTDETGNSLSGTTVVLRGVVNQTTQTDNNGNYSFSGLPEGQSYTVTPSRNARVFVPVSRVFKNLYGGGSGNFVARSQTNGKIVFTRNVNGNLNIWTMNADGTNAVQLTNSPEDDEKAQWSPDGRKIIFQRGGGLNAAIFVMDADGGNLRRVTPEEGSSPVWSPDGRKIAYSRRTFSFKGFYTINIDGTDEKRIFAPFSGVLEPLSWSPDGSKISFTRQPPLLNFSNTNYHLYTMDPSGLSQTLIVNNGNTTDYEPDYSPDGLKLVYLVHDNHITWTLAVANADGTGQALLGPARNGSNPAWSPDGTKLLFIDQEDIWTANIDGSNRTNLTQSGTIEKDADWQPVVATSGPNLIDDVDFLVREHYLDFLNRTADAPGLAFWKNEITSCGTDLQCLEVKRINVSAAFYLSIEFQQTGYLVEKLYKAAYGDAVGTSTLGGVHQLPVPIVRLNEFLTDTQQIGQGVIVGAPDWEALLNSNKQAFVAEFVERSRFKTPYPSSMTPLQFVNALDTNAGHPLSAAERDQLIADLTSGVKTRAQVLLAVAEDPGLDAAEFNRAFVLMQYFGYLRRNPNDPQDADYTGYEFWLTKLNQFNGNFVNAEMVKAFLVSGEYRQRFGP